RRRALALAGTAGLAAGVLVAGVGARDRASGALAQLAERSARVSAELVVRDDPRPSRGGGYVVQARVSRLSASRVPGTVGAVDLRLSVPVLVIALDGAGWADLLPSSRIAVDGALRPPQAADTVGAVLLVRGPPRLVAGPVWYQRLAGVLRAELRESASVLPEPASGLLPALVVGDTSRLDPRLKDDFRAAGMTHLTAVSGGNVAIVTAAVVAVLGSTRAGVRSRALWVAGMVIVFTVVARPSASVLRAGAMALLAAFAAGAGRPSSAVPALAAATGALVLVQPDLALSAGFALSVLATAGIVVLAPRWRETLARWLPGWLADGVAVAAAAQLACTPVLAWLGGSVSLVAVPANVLAAVAVAPVTVLGVVALAAGPVCAPLGTAAAYLAGWPCRWLILVARTAADVPGGTLGWPGGPLGALAALAALPAAVALLRTRRGRRVAAAVLAGLLVARVLLVPRLAGWPPPGWRVVACSVGQGDALVLTVGAGAAVLVDAGPDEAALARCLDDLGVRRVPLVLLSHLHADHVEGLAAVLGRLPVGEVLVGPLREPAAAWAQVSALARAAGVLVTTVGAGATRAVGDVSLELVGPLRLLRGTDSDANNNSLVALARTGGLTVLLTGDAERPQQSQLLREGVLAGARIDVLKVAHHGAAEQEPGMLAGSGAEVALICVGEGNDYGHPAPATLAALAAAGIPVARTDIHGDAAVVANPGGGARLVVRGGPR
ncbi:MAG: ComEC/Rec2 family competence protein, partial [Frankia sp.]|nr:ComEC/Rec2 family competence protein [Frankia sp.]